MSYELASDMDKERLIKILSDDRYSHLRAYEIQIELFYKYGKRDKDDNLKTPALQKYGKPIYAQTKIVSAFNRLTDNIDVKIIINKDIWDDLSDKERDAVLDNELASIQVKEDKEGEPIYISEDSDKVQLKLRKPDFFIEGYLDILNIYGKNYIPWQESKNISEKVN